MESTIDEIARRAEDELWLYKNPIEAVEAVAKRMGIKDYDPRVELALQRFGVFYRRDWDAYMDAKSVAAINLSTVRAPADIVDQVGRVKHRAVAYLRQQKAQRA